MFHVKHEGWTVELLSPAQRVTLRLYEELLLSRAIPGGMVGVSDSEHLHARHILDSLRALPHISSEAHLIIDLGSGAGLPGLPVAVARPDLDVTLAEPRQARAAFLELTVEKLGLANVRVSPRPAEELTTRFDVCLARGFAGARRTWAVARPLLQPVGELIYWAGRSFRRDDLPSEVRSRTVGDPTLESGGPIVIMSDSERGFRQHDPTRGDPHVR
jgi:16S rRNA (guanine527-N7)-methyltransferase